MTRSYAIAYRLVLFAPPVGSQPVFPLRQTALYSRRFPSHSRSGGMRNCLSRLVIVLAVGIPAFAQTAAYRAPRLNGHPDLNGVWQALNTANWDLQDHSAQPGPLSQTGAIGAVPAGRGVVEG